MKRSFARRLESLDDIFRFAEAFSASTGLGETAVFEVNLILEELFVNMVKHRPEGTHDVVIELDRQGEQLRISLTDRDVDPFDLTQASAPDIHAPLEERRAGGLGIHLVRVMSNHISYEYKNRNSTITVLKDMESRDVRNPNR